MTESGLFEHPERIGPYHILQVIGEGGMGIVYEAEQKERVRRRVAIKMIKVGMDTKDVMARFDAERQALAVMDHPGIATVLDAGVSEAGNPYFVMELVPGVPLDEYCNGQRIGTAGRLEIFIAICQAVQHAHQKGIIHRDLKPSNVLVRYQDGTPTPKIIDFGVAKAISQRLTEKTIVTEYGMAVGTLAYMSPEQAEMSGLDVDTRTDVYSLGVMLYELLTGQLPIDPKEHGMLGFLARLVARETDAPTPSTKVRASVDAERHSVRRGTNPRTLSKELRGDLDWIVMKAMDKDRSRRFETANGLALDLARYLANEPVVARPPSTRYRATKFVQRHRAGVVAALGVVIALISGAALATVGMVRATRAEQQTQQVSDFLVDLFEVSNPSRARGNAVTAREILDAGAARIERELADEPLVQARMLGTIGVVYTQLGLYDEAEPLLKRALANRESLLSDEHLEVAASALALGTLYAKEGRTDEAEPLLKRAIAIRERRLGSEHLEVAEAVRRLGAAYLDGGETEKAGPFFMRALEIRERQLPTNDPDVAVSLNDVGVFHTARAQPRDAEPYLRRALTIREQNLGPGHPDIAQGLNNMGVLYGDLGDNEQAATYYRRARDLFRQTLGAEHPTTALVGANIAEIYWKLGRYEEAEQELLQSLEVLERTLDPNHLLTGTTLVTLANVYRDQGRLADAEGLYERGLAIQESTVPPDDPYLIDGLREYEEFLRMTGRADEADVVENRIRAARGDTPDSN